MKNKTETCRCPKCGDTHNITLEEPKEESIGKENPAPMKDWDECNCCHCKWLKESRCICGFVYPDKRIDEAEHEKAIKEHHCKVRIK